MANTGYKGIDVRQTGNQLVFRALLQTAAGALLGTGTTLLSIVEIQSDGTIKSYDFSDNTFKTTALTTATLAMTHRPSNNAGTTTGLWTAALSTLTGFTAGAVYVALVNNSGASPTDQAREFQYGSAEGDLVVTANGTGVGTIDANMVKAGPSGSGTAQTARDLGAAAGLLQGTASSGGANTITLAGAVATDSLYKYCLVQIQSGTGAGQARLIVDYVGSTKVATVNKAWTTNPDNTSAFTILPWTVPTVVHSGIAQAGAGSAITLQAIASSTDDIFKGQTITIFSGTGVVQSRIISAYNGTTKVATVNEAWTTNPDSTSVYEIAAVGRAWADLRQAVGQNQTLDSNNVLNVSTKYVGGTLQTAGDVPASLVSLLTAVNNLNNLSALANIYGPALLEIPDSSSTDFPFTFVARDEEGHLVDLDASPTITAANGAGTDRSANLSAVTHASTGVYTFKYNVTSAATEEGLRIAATGAVNSSARRADYGAAVVNYDSITTLNAVKAQTDKLLFDGSNNVKSAPQTDFNSLQKTSLNAATPTVTLAASDTLKIRSGTAQAGGAKTITLDAGSSAADNLYRYRLIVITGGTGAGQVNTITGYVGSTKVATVANTWLVNPDNTSAFSIFAVTGVTTGQGSALVMLP